MHVEEDVAVDEDSAHPYPAGEGQDLVGASVAPSPGRAAGSTTAAPRRGPPAPIFRILTAFTDDVELDLDLRQEPQAVPDLAAGS